MVVSGKEVRVTANLRLKRSPLAAMYEAEMTLGGEKRGRTERKCELGSQPWPLRATGLSRQSEDIALDPGRKQLDVKRDSNVPMKADPESGRIEELAVGFFKKLLMCYRMMDVTGGRWHREEQ